MFEAAGNVFKRFEGGEFKKVMLVLGWTSYKELTQTTQTQAIANVGIWRW